MSLAAALKAIESGDDAQRERAIPILAASDNGDALLALERAAQQEPNLQLRFMAKEGALTLRRKLSGLTPQQGGGAAPKKLDVNHLKVRLMDPDPKRRLRGVRSALATRDRAALKYLRLLLPKEPEPKVAGEICKALGVLGQKGESKELLAALKSPAPKVRIGAIQGLGYLRDRSVYPTLVAMLQDKDKGVRAKAFETLTKLGKPRLLRLLVRMLGSSRSWSRKAAVRACAKISSPESAEILIKARAQDPDERIRREATKALLHLARKGNRTAGAALAKDPPQSSPKVATDGLVIEKANQGAQHSPASAGPASGSFEGAEEDSHPSSVSTTLPQPPLELLNLDDDDDPDASELEDLELSTSEVMLGGLNDPSPEVRMDNVAEIMAQRDRSLAPQLAARLPLEENTQVLGKLILAIGKLGRKKDARRLVRFLTHSEKRIRANSVEALSTLGEESALRACIPLLEDEDNRTRANAVVALQGLDDVDVVTTLKQMAKHPNTDMRLSAIYAALEVGGTEIDPVLDYLLRDKDQDVKDKALKALTILEDQRMAPMHGVIGDVNASMARIEKLSAWRGGEIEDDDDEEAPVASSSKSLDEAAEAILGKLSGDTESVESVAPEEKSANWGRRPAATMARDTLEGPSGGGLQGKWEAFLHYLSNPSPAQPKKGQPSGDVDTQSTVLVIGVTIVVVLVIYFLVLGGGGGDDIDVGDF